MEMYRNPQYRGVLEDYNRSSTEINRSCGDSVTLYLRVDPQGIVEELRFEGEGCSLSQSSAELACRLARGLDCTRATTLAQSFIRFLLTEHDNPVEPGLPEEFSLYNDLRKYPMRQKCALMAWEILESLCVAQG
jgi:nitrogen fixation NifU-like protein